MWGQVSTQGPTPADRSADGNLTRESWLVRTQPHRALAGRILRNVLVLFMFVGFLLKATIGQWDAANTYLLIILVMLVAEIGSERKCGK